MNYAVAPGLYSIGNPNEESPVLVSANYKLTFDTLRKNLSGFDCWLLILDTDGVNVWCAAGKGTFGVDELANRIGRSGLTDIVTHRNLILPQLGAVGVNAREVKARTGFSVIYGPVRAGDIKDFVAAGNKAIAEMRTVKFTLPDRLVLAPVEFISAIKTSLAVFGVMLLLNLFAARDFGGLDIIAYLGAVVCGTVVAPVLLPAIPGRAFAWKGWITGLIWVLFAVWKFGWMETSPLLAAGYLLLLPAVSGYLMMNFTGASTYTSYSGVVKEMKLAIPILAVLTAAGAVLALINAFAY
jgi:hypothetical protein